MEESKLFAVHFNATGMAVGKLRNEVHLRARTPFVSENMLATDEGERQGGEGTAPTPLEYFLTGLVGCLMTQIRVFSKRMKIPLDDVTVSCDAKWDAVSDPEAPYRGQPVGFSVDIDITAPEEVPQKHIENLIHASRKGCFVEQTLMQSNHLTHRCRVNDGSWIAL